MIFGQYFLSDFQKKKKNRKANEVVNHPKKETMAEIRDYEEWQ